MRGARARRNPRRAASARSRRRRRDGTRGRGTRRCGSRTSIATRRSTAGASPSTVSNACPTRPDAPVMAIEFTSIDWPCGGRASTRRRHGATRTTFPSSTSRSSSATSTWRSSSTRCGARVPSTGRSRRSSPPRSPPRARPSPRSPTPTGPQLEELAHAAQTHVVDETGLAAMLAAPVRAMQRREWAALHITALRPVLETLAATLGKVFDPEAMRGLFDQVDLSAVGLPDLGEGTPSEGDAEALAAMAPMLAPVLLGVQAGSMIGYLARHALGRYDLPLPTSDEPTLAFVVANLDEFEEAWSLERADLRFYVAIHEVVHAAERSVPWVRERLVELATDYVRRVRARPQRPRRAPARLPLRRHRPGGPGLDPGARDASRRAARRVANRSPADDPRAGPRVPRGARGVRRLRARARRAPADPVVRPDPRGDGAPPHRAR